MNKLLVISTTNELWCFDWDRIMCITADGNYSHIVTAEGEEKMVVMQLGQILELVNKNAPKNTFVRVGKSHIVNLNYVSHINLSKQQLEMTCAVANIATSRDLNISRESLKQLKELIEKLN